MPGRRLVLALLVCLAVVLPAAATGNGAANAGDPAPVPSLQPAKTAALWARLVARPAPRTQGPAACRPLRAVFYAASDWLRLTTRLAANASPCADYYVSIPPLVADKTQPRPDQAWRIRALGPRFHALAEIHWATWSRWVASTGSSWHAAGVTARTRMAAAGYDVAAGDTWALNEVGSAVRRGEGDARTNLREFLRGLYEGGAGARPAPGAAFVIGLGQRTADLSVYQGTVQSWLADASFWAEVATYVSDWSQEVYGDVRSWAIPGAPVEVRREYLNDYLQHVLVVAGAGPAEIEVARSYLREAYSPLANAAWQRDTAYGWTMVPPEQMAAYVSAQVDALRSHSAATGQARDHWGFAWAPRNASGTPAGEFAAQTASVLDRLAAAVRDSGDPEISGGGACGPAGQNLWCTGDLADARPAETWRSFRAWSQLLIQFTTPPQTLVAGTASAPMGLRLVTSTGLPAPPRAPLALTLTSSSASGTFSTSPSGPFVPSLTLTLPAGVSTVEGIYYLDPGAGSHVLTASAAGTTGATQTVTVTPGPVARTSVSPVSGSVRARGSLRFRATATDSFGNAVPASFAWQVAPAALGTVEATGPGSAAFTAGRLVRKGQVVVLAAGAAGSAAASVTVLPATLRIAAIESRRTAAGARLAVRVVDGAGRPVPGAVVRLDVRSGGRLLSAPRAVTGPAGRALLRITVRRGTCVETTVRRASAAGFRWDGRTPRSRICRPR
jgi:hypothetical protein